MTEKGRRVDNIGPGEIDRNTAIVNAAVDLKNCEILVVDDNPDSLRMMVDLLLSSGYQVRPADVPKLALESALSKPPDLMLLDVRMPGMDGFELARRLKSDLRTADVPILFISASNDILDQVQGFQVGAVDFLPKPIRRDEVLARVETHLSLYKIKRNLEQLVEKRTEALRKSEWMFRGLFENASVGIVYVDAAHRIVQANDSFTAFSGYRQDELKERVLTDLIHSADRKEVIGYLQRLQSESLDAVRFECRFIPKSSEYRWGAFSVGALRDESVPGFSVVVEDITTRRRLQEERDRNEQDIRDSRERLRALSRHLQNVREEEKAHIAREIHDEFGSALTAIKLDATWLKRRHGRNDPELTEKLSGIIGSLDAVIGTTRRIVTELRPTLLDDLGFWAAVEWQVEEFEKRSGIACRIVDGHDRNARCEDIDFSPALSITLYRVLQEALTNVARHAEATRVDVTCRRDGEQVILSVLDNGIGFDETSTEKPGSHGLRGMHERVGAMGGHLRIESEPHGGTLLEIKLPLSGNMNE